jgi:AcrR family transcriptional regulator
LSSRALPRRRLVETAARLFYERGLPNIGINEVTDRAGVARMTLYNNFASKEALALAAFQHQAEERRRMVEAHLGEAATPAAGVAAMFDVAELLAAQPRFRGCAFINVALQTADRGGALHALVLDHKLWLRGKFQGLAELAGARQPQRLAQQLLALWDGAIVEAYIQGSVEPIKVSRLAAKALLVIAAGRGR